MSASMPPLVLGVVLAMLGGLEPSATPGGRDADVRPRWEIECADSHCELWLYDVGRTRAWTVPREALGGSLEPSGADGGVLLSIEPCAAGERRPELVFDLRAETFAPAGTGHRAGAQLAEPKGCLGSPTAPDVEGYSGWLELGHVYDLEAELEGPDSVLPDPPVQLPHHHAGRVVLLDRDRFPDLAGAEAGRFTLRVEVVGLEVRQREERMWTSEYFLRVIDCAPVTEAGSADPRFVGLERLYFDRLEDPADAAGGLRPAREVTLHDEELRRLLPAELDEADGPVVEGRLIEPAEGPIHFGLFVRDWPLPAEAGAGVFLRQVIDGTHSRIHEQFWALYTDGRRTDLWFFSPTPDRTEGKLVAPLQVEEVRPLGDSGLELRVSGSMIRPQGAGWLQGVDLIFAAEGSELGYRYAVRRYSFTYGYDLGGGRSSLVGVEIPRQRDGRTVIEQRLALDVPRDLEERCGVRPSYNFPGGTFEEMVEIATCIIAASPTAEARSREVDEPTFIERGGRPAVEPRAPKGLPEASLDPPSDAVELCAGHLTGAPLSDRRPGPHISWTLYTSAKTRPVVAERYYDALGDEGHTTDSDCDRWKRPVDPPERIVEVCELAAEGPWSDCPPPPEKARSRILISTMARAE